MFICYISLCVNWFLLFFLSLLSGRIPSIKDEKGAVSKEKGVVDCYGGHSYCCLVFCMPQIFIDRDPQVFKPILNFLRTRNVDLRYCLALMCVIIAF